MTTVKPIVRTIKPIVWEPYPMVARRRDNPLELGVLKIALFSGIEFMIGKACGPDGVHWWAYCNTTDTEFTPTENTRQGAKDACASYVKQVVASFFVEEEAAE